MFDVLCVKMEDCMGRVGVKEGNGQYFLGVGEGLCIFWEKDVFFINMFQEWDKVYQRVDGRRY